MQKLQKTILYFLVPFSFLFIVLYVMNNVFDLSWNYPCGPGAVPCSVSTYKYMDLYEMGYITSGLGIGFFSLLLLVVYLISVLKKFSSPLQRK